MSFMKEKKSTGSHLTTFFIQLDLSNICPEDQYCYDYYIRNWLEQHWHALALWDEPKPCWEPDLRHSATRDSMQLQDDWWAVRHCSIRRGLAFEDSICSRDLRSESSKHYPQSQADTSFSVNYSNHYISMNETIERLTFQEQITIGTSLRLAICDNWKYRRSPILRKAIKERIALIRKFDSCQEVYLSPRTWLVLWQSWYSYL